MNTIPLTVAAPVLTESAVKGWKHQQPLLFWAYQMQKITWYPFVETCKVR